MIKLPALCPRNIQCRPLSQIKSDSGKSYFCCGENNAGDRDIITDKYSLCFKNEFCDLITDNDKRDLVHQMAVIAQALAVIEEG